MANPANLGGASGPLPPGSSAPPTQSSLAENSDLIPNFLTNFLSENDTSLYRGAQWLVTFNGLAGLLPAMKKALKYNPQGSWNFESNAQKLIVDKFQTPNCLFAQAISLPGESFQPNPAGNISSGAFIRPYVGSGRNAFPLLRMSFLETMASFADNVLRPWIIATQTFGMIAPQQEDENYRLGTMECWKLSPYSINNPATSTSQLVPVSQPTPTVVMKITFHDVCCVSLGDEEYNYNALTAPMLRDAQFAYSSYSVNRLVGGSGE